MAQSPSTVCVLTGCGSQSVGPLAHLTLDPQGKSPGRPDPDPGPALQPHHRDFILGRSLNADVLIRDVQISRQHALIQVRWGGPGPDQWWLQDPGSINGVFLNGRPIPVQSFVPLQHGHRLSLEPKHGYQWQVHLRPAPPLPLDPASAPPMSRSTPAAHRLPSPSRDGPAAKRARLAGRGPASPTTRPARAHEPEPEPDSSSQRDSEKPKNPAQLACQNSESQLSSAHEPEPEPEPASSSQRDSEKPKNPAQLSCQSSESQLPSAQEPEPEPASSSQRDSEKPKNPAQLACQNSESQLSSAQEPEPGPSRSGIGPLETPRNPGQSQSQDGNRGKMHELDPGPSSSFKAKFSEELSCTICNEMFIQPKTLPCGHVFCAFCVLQWKKRCGSAMSCPNCRQKVGRDKITPNVYVENLINNFIQGYGDDMKAERERQMAERSAQEEAAARADAEREMKRNQNSRGRRGRGRRGRGASTSRTIRDMFSRVNAPNPGDHRLPQPSNSSQNRRGTTMYSTIDVESDSDEDDSDDDILAHANESDSSEDPLSDSPVPGDPNAPYGGYGYCYGCGRTGHWLPGCLGL
ncbi:E3 ubiquitin-protein ligase RNF8-like isoform X2 [Tigriopus californicus]|uniref:E3 ubiquitin-protein ligase RNF8-like isoform X2 n=1 Tax=Tigriopus californicus TaxID=6832 RepID=UPI0027DA1136|nr:E3 ubiquitin-protein ligase RNF8-like isoform X2 [Tigriopus californicus]